MKEGPIDEQTQWAMLIKVNHGSGFGHRIVIETRSRGRDVHSQSGGSWKGLGMPEGALTSARSLIDTIFTEHCVTRYGVAGELPLKWSGEPDPF